MTIQKQLLLDIQKIEDATLLNQLYHFVQLMKKMSIPQQENKSAVLEFAGKIDDVEAEELKVCIEIEFSTLEGDW